jgi:putative DNA primase/helicase
MSELLEAALRYAKRGWRVFPLDGKRPIADSGGFHDATTDTKQLRRWWRDNPDWNVGLACDSRRGPIIVDLDAPKPHERDGFAFIDDLVLPETRQAKSRANRMHLYFDAPIDGQRIKRLIRPFRENGKKFAIDILGDGGYVVAPPSIHPETGKPYRWIRKTHLAPFPTTLLDLLGDSINLNKQTNAPPLPDIIGEGERDNLLTSLAGSMRRRGADEETILAALRDLNHRRVNPPLPDKDLRRIAKSIAKKPPAGIGENLTDLGNARRFIAQHVEGVRNVNGKWYIWDGTRWAPDDTGEVERAAKNTIRTLYVEASHAADENVRDSILKHAAKSESAGRVHGLLDLASTEPEISISQDQLDADPWLLNVENGTIDLKTGKLREHRRGDLITKLAPVEYDPKATAPRWERFMSEIMGSDPELVEYLQRAVGYGLTGDTREECLFFCYGGGANGKSTFLETLRGLLGAYAQQSDFSTFVTRSGDGPRTDIARMRGARFVTASEADADKGFDARIIKTLTGNDTMVARRLYEAEFEFRPQHKLFLAANHKPIVKEVTEAFWRRMRLVPFIVTFKGANREKKSKLESTLRNELPGILNWALAGCKRWQREGLLEPRAVRRATRDYRDENDLLGEFISQQCTVSDGTWTPTTELYRAFSDWWTETRGPRAVAISMGWFARMLGERPELIVKKRNHIRGWCGIALKQEMGYVDS